MATIPLTLPRPAMNPDYSLRRTSLRTKPHLLVLALALGIAAPVPCIAREFDARINFASEAHPGETGIRVYPVPSVARQV